VKRFFVVVITDPTLVNTYTSNSDHEKHDSIGDKKKKAGEKS
jgi:hypothetical protein